MSSFWFWWQHLPQHISPYIIQLGPIRLYWYGLMYVVAFTIAYFLIVWRIKKKEVDIDIKTLQDFMTWAVLGIVIGGRLGYAVFYAPEYFFTHPLELVLPFSFSGGTAQFVGIAGMSYHGGLIGITVAALWFAKKHKLNLWKFIDAALPAIPLGFMFGRIGNFLNGELYGRATNVVWGMYFPRDSLNLLRHPSQFYEAFLEGALGFLLLWPLRNIKSLQGLFLPIYLVFYGAVRFIVEFFREPDIQLGFVFRHLTQGQLLSLLTILAGIILGLWFKKQHVKQ